MQCVCGAAGCCSRVGAAAAPSVLTEQLLQVKTKVYKGSAALRLSLIKNYFQRRLCRASGEQHFKADWQNFGAGKILPDLSF